MHIYTERVNKGYLGYILNHFEELGVPMGVYENGKKTTDLKSVHTLLVKYYQSLNDEGEVSIEYRQKNGYGRKWTMRTGLTNLSKVIRHTIGSEYHIDIDMENAHPVLLLNWLEQQQFNNCPTLKYYIENRYEVLRKYMEKGYDRDAIKTLFLSMTNGGELKMDLKDDFTTKYYNEITGIYTFIREKEPLLYEKGLKKKPNNPEGAMINLLMCELENRALDCIIHYFKEKGVKITSLAYDGLTIERTEENQRHLDDYLRGAENAIRRIFPSNIKLNEKKMTMGLPNCEEEEYEFFEEEESEPERLIQPVKKENVCRCELPHELQLKIMDLLTEGQDYTLLYQFVNGCVFRGCVKTIMEKFALKRDFPSSYEEYFLDNFHQYHEHMSWQELYKLIPPKQKSIRTQIQKCIKNHKKILDEESLPYIEPMPVVSKPFNENDHYKKFEEYLLSTKFSNLKECVDYFVSNFDRYIKIFQKPLCYIVNTGTAGYDMMNVRDLRLKTRYYTTTEEGEVRLVDLDLIRWGSRCLLDDCDVRNALPNFHKFVFFPKLDYAPEEYVFNTFKGFQAKTVEKVDMDKIEPFLFHIKTCWASKDEDLYDYILQWLRVCFLTPWIKTEVVLLLYGEERTGKGFLIDHLLIPLIYGRSLATATAGLDKLTQRFNTICMDKCFIACNEVNSRENWNVSFDTLKAIISDPTISVEMKGKDMMESYNNFINMIATTNHEFGSVKMSQHDGRYACMEVSPVHKGNRAYFDRLHEACTQENANHFYTFICQLPRTRNLRDIPMTHLRQQMMNDGKNSVELFCEEINERRDFWKSSYDKHSNEGRWYDFIRVRLVGLTKNESTDSKFISSANLYDAYKMYSDSMGMKNRKSAIQFGRIASKYFVNYKKGNSYYQLF
jgi:hypothetical protein